MDVVFAASLHNQELLSHLASQGIDGIELVSCAPAHPQAYAGCDVVGLSLHLGIPVTPARAKVGQVDGISHQFLHGRERLLAAVVELYIIWDTLYVDTHYV